ncbi:MAG TPA: RDD family protein [Jatrophihabitantaceae bacterium]
MVNAQTELTSGEGVAFDLNHAGVGSRLVAASIDLALQVIASFILLAATGGLLQNADDAAVGALVLVELVLVVAGYPILMEWLAHGRTIGKMCLGLRVVRDDGGPIGFRQALVRGLAGLVLEKPGLLAPFTTAAGVLTMIFSQRTKRLGDMMAGTFVLNERAGPRRSLLPRDFEVPYQLQPWAASLDLSRLDDQLALGVRQFVVRATDMTPAAQQSLGEDLRARVEAVTTPPPPPGAPTPWVLITVLAERRRRADLAAPHYQQPYQYAPPQQYARPQQHAPLSQHQPPPDAPPRSPFAPPS